MYFVFLQISFMFSSVMFGFKDFRGKEYDYFILSQNIARSENMQILLL